jgi:hypothetical protein
METKPGTATAEQQSDLRGFVEAYNNYSQSVAALIQGGYSRLQEVEQSYARAVCDAAYQPDGWRRVEEAGRTYVQEHLNLRARGDLQKQSQEAFVAYVKQLQKAFASLDATKVDAATLSTIGRSLVQVACVAGGLGVQHRG